MLWGIAVADTRVPGYEKAEIEISHTKLTCWIDGKDVVLNDDHGAVRSGPAAAVHVRHGCARSDDHGGP